MKNFTNISFLFYTWMKYWTGDYLYLPFSKLNFIWNPHNCKWAIKSEIYINRPLYFNLLNSFKICSEANIGLFLETAGSPSFHQFSSPILKKNFFKHCSYQNPSFCLEVCLNWKLLSQNLLIVFVSRIIILTYIFIHTYHQACKKHAYKLAFLLGTQCNIKEWTKCMSLVICLPSSAIMQFSWY